MSSKNDVEALPTSKKTIGYKKRKKGNYQEDKLSCLVIKGSSITLTVLCLKQKSYCAPGHQ